MKEHLYVALTCAVIAFSVGWVAGFTANSPDKPRGTVVLADWRE